MGTIKERLMDRKNKELGYALDELCRKHAEVGFSSIDELRRALVDIRRGADKLGCRLMIQMVDSGKRYRPVLVEDFCDNVERYLDEDTFIEITFLDGEEPGNQYMLTLNDYEDHIEELADFIFIPNIDDAQMVESTCRVTESTKRIEELDKLLKNINPSLLDDIISVLPYKDYEENNIDKSYPMWKSFLFRCGILAKHIKSYNNKNLIASKIDDRDREGILSMNYAGLVELINRTLRDKSGYTSKKKTLHEELTSSIDTFLSELKPVFSLLKKYGVDRGDFWDIRQRLSRP